MDNNYTPIDLNKIERKDNGLNTILLLIVTFTALVLAMMLFVLIQKKLSQTKNQLPTLPPTVVPTKVLPTEPLITPTISTATPVIRQTTTPEASPTSTINQQ